MKNDKKQFEIDMVYLWVDGNDPKWQAKRNAHIGKTIETSAVNCEGRYANNDELKYSLRSLEKYAPWIRKIFIITDNQTPEWLDTSNPKIKIVDHTEIMPPQSLPCFNSSVIEHFICKIPDLAEHFLYGNDDMYINRAVNPDTFFTSEGEPIIRFNRRLFRKLYLLIRKNILKRPLSNYNQIVRNAALLVEKKYGTYYTGKSHHNIDPYSKSYCQYVEELFKDEIEPTFINHVRSENDIQRHIYYYTALAERHGKLEYITQKTSLRIHIHNEKHYSKLEKYNPLLFCMNDSQFAKDIDRKRSIALLEKRFPNKSQFEK